MIINFHITYDSFPSAIIIKQTTKTITAAQIGKALADRATAEGAMHSTHKTVLGYKMMIATLRQFSETHHRGAGSHKACLGSLHTFKMMPTGIKNSCFRNLHRRYTAIRHWHKISDGRKTKGSDLNRQSCTTLCKWNRREETHEKPRFALPWFR